VLHDERLTVNGLVSACIERCISASLLCARPAYRTCVPAMFSEPDNMSGVSENIIMGQLCPLGTACFDLMLDVDMLKFAIEVRARA
jgi:hypothetical protein